MTIAGQAQTRITLSEAAGGDGLAWFWALGEDRWTYNGTPVDLTGDRFDEVAASIAEYVEVWSPPVLREHKRESAPLGVVERVRVLTQAEAEALGIPQAHARALYVGARLNETGRALDEGGALVYGSVGLDLGWTDEHGRKWPAVLKEYSATTIPHLKRGNVNRPALAGVQLREADAMDETLINAIQSIADALARLEAKIDGMAPAPDDAPDDAPDEAPAEGEAPAENVEAMDGDEAEAEATIAASELAARDRRISALERTLAERDARDQVAACLKGKAFAGDTAKLVKLRLSDPEAFGILVDNLPAAPTPTDRTAGPNAPAERTVHDLALSIMASESKAGRECTYTDAAKRAAAQIRG